MTDMVVRIKKNKERERNEDIKYEKDEEDINAFHYISIW